MTVSVNEQVAGHKVIVKAAPPADSARRQASCECGWKSSIGHTEQVMPEIRSHLESALRDKHAGGAGAPGRAQVPSIRAPRRRNRWTLGP